MTKAVTTEAVGETFAILKPEVREAIAEAFDGEAPDLRLSDLPSVVYPGAGDDRFIVKVAGAERKEDSITGVVLGQRARRALYLSPYSAGSTDAPDCGSQDGINGTPQTVDGQLMNSIKASDGSEIVFGGDCASCPLNQWQSRRMVKSDYTGEGKACSESRVLMLLPPDKVRPYILRLPSTALGAWNAFKWELVDRGIGLSRAIVRFSLTAKSGETPQLKIETVGELPIEDAKTLKSLMPSFSQPQLAAPAEDDGAIPF